MNGPGYIMSQASLFGHAEVIGFGDQEFYVREVPRDFANRLIIQHHYSHKVFPGSVLHLGAYVGNELCGILQWGRAMNPASIGAIVQGATGTDALMELNRMWLADGAPRQTASRAIGCSVKLIRKKHTSAIVLQSFADERCGKFGGVYQACSWGYYGEHTSTFWELDGEWYHNIAMTVRGEELEARAGAQHLQRHRERAKRHDFRQFRYLKFLRPWAERRCLLARLPYPKPGDQHGDAGAAAPG